MAKSIRSKRKRKLRAIKRVRYAKKELERLKKTLGIADDAEMNTLNEVEVAEVADDVSTTVNGNVIEFSLKDKNEEEEKTKELKINVDLMKIGEAEAFIREDERMEVITEKDIKKLGRFPKWMNQRQIQKVARAIRKTKNKSKRIAKKKRLKK